MIVLTLLLGTAAGGCVRTLAAVHPPPAPRSGHVSEQAVSRVVPGQTAAEVRAALGEPLDVERAAEHEVWRYRVQAAIRCTIITKRFLGPTTVQHPPPDPDARIMLRDGRVDTVRIVPAAVPPSAGGPPGRTSAPASGCRP